MNPDQIGCLPGYAVALYGPDSSLKQFLDRMERLSALGYRNFGIAILEPDHIDINREPGAIDKLLKTAHATSIRLDHFTIWHCGTNLSSSNPGLRRIGVR